MSGTSHKTTLSPAAHKPGAWIRATGVAAVLSLSLGACATQDYPRTTGERLSDRGSRIGDYGTDWSEGQADVRQAEKAIKKSDRSRADGERDLARARKELAEAEQQISDATAKRVAALKRIEDGRAQMIQAEEDYARTKAGPSAIKPDDGVL